MGKRMLSIYAKDEDITLAKSRGINLSKMFREILSTELELGDISDATTKEEIINKLKAKVAMLSSELNDKTKELIKLKKQIIDLEAKNKPLKNNKINYVNRQDLL